MCSDTHPYYIRYLAQIQPQKGCKWMIWGSELKHTPPILWILCEKVFIYACKIVKIKQNERKTFKKHKKLDRFYGIKPNKLKY